MIIKQISVFVENRKGRLAEIIGILSDNGINIRALSIADTTNFGVLRLIVNEPEKTEKILKEHKLSVSETAVIGIAIPDKPGALTEALKLLAHNDIFVDYMYAFVSNQPDKAGVVLRVNDENRAKDILKEKQYEGFCG